MLRAENSQGILDKSSWCNTIAHRLLNAWSASNARVWLVDSGGWRVYSTGGGEDVSSEPTVNRLLDLACERQGILWIEPSANNPCWRAIGRVSSDSQVVLELVFEEASGLPIPRDAILLGLEHNANLLARFGDSFWSDNRQFADISRYIDSVAFEEMQQRRMICERIGEQLRPLVGQKFASLEENQKLAAAIHRLLEENGLRLQCTTCGEPAILRCLKAGNSPAGSFLFDHRVGGRRTMHGGRVEVPNLIVVDKAPRTPVKTALLKLTFKQEQPERAGT